MPSRGPVVGDQLLYYFGATPKNAGFSTMRAEATQELEEAVQRKLVTLGGTKTYSTDSIDDTDSIYVVYRFYG